MILVGFEWLKERDTYSTLISKEITYCDSIFTFCSSRSSLRHSISCWCHPSNSFSPAASCVFVSSAVGVNYRISNDQYTCSSYTWFIVLPVQTQQPCLVARIDYNHRVNQQSSLYISSWTIPKIIHLNIELWNNSHDSVLRWWSSYIYKRMSVYW